MELLAHKHRNVPAYPFPPQNWYKQANTGLYGGTRIQFGHNVSEKNEIKTRRIWRPNIHDKRLWSQALGRWVRVKIQARVLRTVDKVGGLDEYLLGEKTARIKDLGVGGWALRWRVMRTPVVQERLERQRRELGLGMRLQTRLGSASEASGTVADATATKRPEEPDVLLEADVGKTPEQLQAREQEIDRAMDEDAEKEKQGLDGGIEL